MSGISLKQKFAGFDEYWTPKIVAELNNQYVKIAKFKGEFVWHSHLHEDEYFQVIKGTIEIHLRDKVVEINEGEFYIVPKGVEHKPVAKQEAHVLMFEPKSTLQTGITDTVLKVEVADQQRI
ncbi:MAG: mannose-6-phosphate isomerase-like protein (cupin superfamily) [Paraglaciecola sp.]|jgi:mannose-6-phosphate isomerase-like protein (cupin superfamily)